MKRYIRDITTYLSKFNSPLGDLCRDMLTDEDLMNSTTKEEFFSRLNSINDFYGEHLNDPIRRYKTIFSTILNA